MADLKETRKLLDDLGKQLTYVSEQEKSIKTDQLNNLINQLSLIRDFQSEQYGTDLLRKNMQEWNAMSKQLIDVANNLKLIQGQKLDNDQFIKAKDLVDSLQAQFKNLWSNVEEYTKRLYAIRGYQAFAKNSTDIEWFQKQYGELQRAQRYIQQNVGLDGGESLHNALLELDKQLQTGKNLGFNLNTSEIKEARKFIKELIALHKDLKKVQLGNQLVQLLGGITPEILKNGLQVDQKQLLSGIDPHRFIDNIPEMLNISNFKDTFSAALQKLTARKLKDIFTKKINAQSELKSKDLQADDVKYLDDYINKANEDAVNLKRELNGLFVGNKTTGGDVPENIKQLEKQTNQLVNNIQKANDNIQKSNNTVANSYSQIDSAVKSNSDQIKALDQGANQVVKSQDTIQNAIKQTEKEIQTANNAISNDNIQKAYKDQANQVVKSQDTIQNAVKQTKKAVDQQKTGVRQFNIVDGLERERQEQDRVNKQITNDEQSEIRNRQKAYERYIKERQNILNSQANLRSSFDQRQADFNKLDTSGLDRLVSRANIARDALKSAFDSGADINKLNSLWAVYVSSTDKVIGRIKAREMAESQAIQKNIAEVRNYVQTQETLTGKKMSAQDQAAYYGSQLSKFKQSQQEYMEVLRLKRNAEAQAAADTRNAWSTILSSVKQAADAINNAVNKIISVIRTVIQIYQKFGKAVVTVFKTVGGSVKNLLTFFSGFGNRLRAMFTGGTDNANKFNKSFGLIQGTATELRSKLLLVSGALNQIFNNELINKAKKLLSSVYQLKTMTGPAVTQDVIDWANSMEHAFGLQARGLISDLSELTGVLYGLGMSGEDVAIGSENLLIMSRYLANMGAAGGDLETVMSKIVSGMKGMTQAIDDLGLSVRDAQMNAFLKDLKAQGGEFANISTDFSSLNEQARVYVRYAALINQFTKNYDVTKLVDSLNTVTGRLSTLKDTWKSLTLTIGTGLTKLASMAATYIIPILKIIETKVIQLFSWLEKTLGLAEGQLSAELTPSINDGASEAVNDYNNQLGETADKLDEVNKASKKASGGLQSFDRINNVTTSKSSDQSQGLDEFDYSSLMTSMLGKLNDMAAQASQSFFEGLNQNLENKIEELKQKLLDYAKNITGRANIDFGFDEKAIKTNLTKVKNDIIKIIKSWGTFVLAIGFKIADDVNIGAIITKVTELLAAFTNLASTMTDVLIPAFNAFYDTGLSKMFTWLGSTTLNGLQLLIDTFNDWSDWFVENQTLILNFFTALGTIFSSVWAVISGKLDSGFGSLSEQFKAFTDDQQSGLVTWMTDIVTNVDSIASDVSTRVQNFLDTVGTKLEWVSNLISGALETLFTGQVPEDATGGYASFYNILLDIKSVVEAIGGGIGIALGLQSPEEASDGALTFYNLLVNVQSIIQTLTPLVLDLVEAFNDFAAENILPFINDKLTQLDTWLKNNSDKVKTLLETVGGIAWDGFTLFVDFTGKLIDYVVQNPDVVVTFFSGLLALKVGSWFVSGAAGIGNMTLGLSNLGTAVSTVGPQITTAFAGINTALSGTVFGSASAALGGLVSPLTLVVALVAGLAIAFIDLWNSSEDFRKAFSDMAETIKIKIDTLTSKFGEGSKFQDMIKKLKDVYDTYLKPVLEVIFKVVGYLATGIVQTLIDGLSLLVDFIADEVQGAIDLVQGLLDVIIGAVTGDDGRVIDGLKKFLNGIYEILGGIPEQIFGTLDVIIQNVSYILEQCFGGIFEGLTTSWNMLKQWFKTKIKEIIAHIKNLLGIHSPSTVFSDIGKNLIDGLKNGISYAWKSLTNFINNKIDGFKKIFKNFADSVGGFFDDIWSGFTDGVSAGWNTVTGAVTDGWNFITGKTRASNAQSITSHANGGSIAGGHLFIANENGVPEMIGKIPGSSKTNVANNQMITDAIFEAVYNAIAEASNQRASVGSTNNSPLGININGFGLIDQSTLQQLARMLAPYLGANNRNIANVNFSI